MVGSMWKNILVQRLSPEWEEGDLGRHCSALPCGGICTPEAFNMARLTSSGPGPGPNPDLIRTRRTETTREQSQIREADFPSLEECLP